MKFGNLILEVVDLARQINSEVDNDEVPELLDSDNQELTVDELTEMHEFEMLQRFLDTTTQTSTGHRRFEL
ncbi:hypothetical protein TNCV_3147691 [Trichonephila clavipes]|nr:hypothetical protein TNCV_3147691 [Trichonephila clavipes]